MTQTQGSVVQPPGYGPLLEFLKKSLIDAGFSAVVLLDLDRFRDFNVDQGVERGDQVLDLVHQYIEGSGWSCFRLAGDEFGLAVEQSAEPFDDEEFRRNLVRFLQAETGWSLTVSGGGVWHPGQDFGQDPRMADMLVSTAQHLLGLAKKAGGDRILWLPRGPADAVEVMRIQVRFYEELARISAMMVRERSIEARVDFLTGLANRRGFEDAFRRMADSARRREEPLALIYLDSDSLKQINDTRGHDAGDRFIQDIAQVLQRVVRGSDFICRWGADEFLVAMENSSAESAGALANRIQHAVATRTEGTVSAGVYCGVPASPDAAVSSADRALYRAKQLGRNRVEFAGEEPVQPAPP